MHHRLNWRDGNMQWREECCSGRIKGQSLFRLRICKHRCRRIAIDRSIGRVRVQTKHNMLEHSSRCWKCSISLLNIVITITPFAMPEMCPQAKLIMPIFFLFVTGICGGYHARIYTLPKSHFASPVGYGLFGFSSSCASAAYISSR